MAGGGAHSFGELRKQMETQNSQITASLTRINTRLDEFDTRLIFIESSLQTLIDTFNHQIQLIQNHLRQSEIQEPKVNSFTSLDNIRIAKLSCPKFNGVDCDIQSWLAKCECFFKLYPLNDTQKVLYMSFCLEGKAETWLNATFGNLDGLTFERFRVGLISRFSRAKHDVLREFRNLKQNGSSVIEYLEKFEELQFHMNQHFDDGFSDDFFVDCFVGGLIDEIKYSLNVHQPKTLARAVELARLLEQSLE